MCPDIENSRPDDGNTFPDNGNSFPDDGQDCPDTRRNCPDAQTGRPDAWTVLPDVGKERPDVGTALSDVGTALVSCVRSIRTLSSAAVDPDAPDPRELFRLQLEEQLRRDAELLYQAHLVRLRAYDIVAQAQGELAGPRRELPPPILHALLEAPAGAAALPAPAAPIGPPPPAAPPAPALRRKQPRTPVNQLHDTVVEALGQLGEVFDKNELCEALGFQLRRASLHDVLRDLLWCGELTLEQRGHGRVPARYRRKPALRPENG